MSTADIVVVDGMSRSGTTLLSALIHSQDRMACYRGVFPEMLALNLGHWPNGTLMADLVPATASVTVENTTAQGRPYQTSRGALTMHWQTLRTKTLEAIQKENQTSMMSLTNWEKLLEDEPKSLSDIDSTYQSLAKKINVDVLALRWNQGIATLPLWKSRPHHKWICCIRNPMDRACSAEKIWRKGHDKTVPAFEAFAQRVQMLWDQIDCIVYYEDLVSNPQDTFRVALENLGHARQKIETSNLRHQDGGLYRNEKADLVEKFGTHKVGEKFSGFYDESIGRYKREMDVELVERYKKIIEKYSFLQRYLDE